MKFIILFFYTIIFTVACGKTSEINKAQTLKQMPESSDKVGWLVSNISLSDISLILQNNPQTKVRIINEKHSLFELFNIQKKEILNTSPNVFVVKNSFFNPQYFQAHENSHIFFNSENSSQPDKVNHQLCENGKKNPQAIIQVSKNIENQSTTINLGETIYVDGLNSLAHPEVPSKLRFMWAIKAPNSSLKDVEYVYDSKISYTPDALGSYNFVLLVQDDRNKCNYVSKTFNVTTNKEFVSFDLYDEFKKDYLSENLKSFEHFIDLDLENLWLESTGKDQIIAVIDSGVNYNHFALKDNILLNSNEIPNNGIDDDSNGLKDDYIGYDFANMDPFPYDDQGHGSHVAGLAASPIFGVAKQAKILAIKAMSPSGGDMGTVSGAIFYAVDRGSKIINISLGNYEKVHPFLELAINYAQQNGVLVVAAAGNGDKNFGLPLNTDIVPNYPSALINENIIAVAAKTKNNIIASYSNYGKESVDVIALGGDSENKLYSTYIENPKGIEIIGKSGTSMATPLVAGIVALAWSQNPQLRYNEIKNLLLNSGEESTELQSKIASGRFLNAVEVLHKSKDLNNNSQD